MDEHRDGEGSWIRFQGRCMESTNGESRVSPGVSEAVPVAVIHPNRGTSRE